MKYDYDVIVVGGGAAGLTSSGMAVNFGAKTLLIEKDKLGGDCTWHGCIPSKTLLHFAELAHNVKSLKQAGITVSDISIDGRDIFKNVRKIRDNVYREADQPSIYEKMGMDVLVGEARFFDDHSLEIETDGGTKRITSRFFIIATGSRPTIPSVKGLDSIPYLTNESIFELTSLPGSLTIIGAGPVGLEMAQAFQRLGTSVSVLDLMDRISVRDDMEYSGILKEKMLQEGIDFHLGIRIDKILSENDRISTEIIKNGESIKVESDSLLLATGRKANLDPLQLENAGVQFDRNGIRINDRCRTNIKHIYACGDVTGRYQLTHMSEHMAKVAVTNALLKWPAKIDHKHVTWCTYTDPEVAHVGATKNELDQGGITYETYRFPYSKLDRAMTEGKKTGLIKVYAKKLSGKILGASIIGKHAGDMICEYALAMKNGVTLRNIADTIHPYPTYGLGNRRAADQWYVRQQSVGMVKGLRRLLGYRGPLPDISDPDRIV